jgi:hypothetical protein
MQAARSVRHVKDGGSIVRFDVQISHHAVWGEPPIAMYDASRDAPQAAAFSYRYEMIIAPKGVQNFSFDSPNKVWDPNAWQYHA